MATLVGWRLSGPSRDIADDFGRIDAPKLKNFFTVAIAARTIDVNPGSENMKTIEFALKQATRPNININYQKVNFYGYRTNVATSTEYGVISLTLYDDPQNRAHDLFEQYLTYVSPISNMPPGSAGSLEDFKPSTIGPLDIKYGPINDITVTHHYVGDNTPKTVSYHYLNPKIQNVILDELDMSQSDVSTVTITFVYDAVNISKG